MDNIGDTVTEGVDQGTDTIRTTITRTLPANVENLTLIGNGAANTLNGKEANDTLTGGAGVDRFLFATALNGSTNFDRITDFSALDDTIRLENAIFMGYSRWQRAARLADGPGRHRVLEQ